MEDLKIRLQRHSDEYSMDEIVEKHNSLVDKFNELSKSHEEMATRLEKIEKHQRHIKSKFALR
jgi:hypothetical protein